MKLSALALIVSQLASVLAVDADNLDGQYSCVGTYIFGRHNDRTAKPSVVLTTVGQLAQVNSGNFYRKRYFGIDGEDTNVDSDFIIDGLDSDGFYVYGQTYAQAPAATVIQYSQMSFLQGLYPASPITEASLQKADDTLVKNGSSVVGPFDGYQYVFMDVQSVDSPGNIWIQGDTNCPASTAAAAAYLKTDAFKKLNESTYDFYQSLSSILPSKKYPSWKLNFGNAYPIYDFMWVNYIHNETLASKWNDTIVAQVRSLADIATWGTSYDPTNLLSDMTIGGQTLLGSVVNYLNVTKTEGSPYINYFTGAYSTMVWIQALMQLNEVDDKFVNMPEYGATYVWDLLLKENTTDYYIQFSFRNGTDSDDTLNAYPLFNTSSTLIAWDDFVEKMDAVSISDMSTWCSTCNATVDMCVPYLSTYESAETLVSKGANLTAIAKGDYTSLDIDTKHSKLSLAAAGGIGAGVTIGVFLILGGFLFLVLKNKKSLNSFSDPILPISDKDAASDKTSNVSTL